METVFIDGSMGEGGGQVLRTSLALSCITGKGLHIENIRAARRNPGLAKQHLSCVQAASQICSGQCQGAVQRSKTLDFQPGLVHSGDFNLDIGSAGSSTLVIQTVLPALFLADTPSTVTVSGGTHNPLALPFDFLYESFLPAIASSGFHGSCKLIRHGFFPAGGGKITFDIHPWRKSGCAGHKVINLCDCDRQFQIHGRIYTAKLAAYIAQRQRKLLLQSTLNIQNIEHIEVTDSDGAGNCVMLRLCDDKLPIIFTGFGMRGKPSEQVIGEVVNSAKHFLASGAAIDRFLADQLVIYMALSKAGAYTTDELSSHLLTNIEVIKKFLPVDFVIERKETLFRILCQPV